MGDSAGGGLALALALAAKDANLPQFAKLILLSPWLDLKMDNPKIQELDRKDTSFATLRDSPETRALMNSHFSAAPKYKFGVQVPSSLRHALYLDRINGDNLWRIAIDKEINVTIFFFVIA